MSSTKIRNEQINSENATDGYVLTADGSGGTTWEVSTGTLVNHDHSGDVGDGGTFDATNLTSGATTDGYVLTADGVGGAAWESPPAGSGTGTVASDTIWDAKGDLAVGIGSNSAQSVPAGLNGQVPVYNSNETAGIKPAYPQPFIETVYASATDGHSGTNTWELVDSMNLTLDVPFVSGSMLCWFTAAVSPKSTAWEHFRFEFYLDSATESEFYLQSKNANPTNSPIFTFNMHSVFTGLVTGSHTVAVRWHDNGTGLDLDVSQRRLTAMICQ